MMQEGQRERGLQHGRLALQTGMGQKLDCPSSSPVTCWPWNLDKSLLLGPHFLMSNKGNGLHQRVAKKYQLKVPLPTDG